jgi:hypothetical protein
VLPESGGLGKTEELPLMQKGRAVWDSETFVGRTIVTVVPLGAVAWSWNVRWPFPEVVIVNGSQLGPDSKTLPPPVTW